MSRAPIRAVQARKALSRDPASTSWHTPACPWHALGHRLVETNSTMAEAQRLAADGAPHGTWVLAERQTAGRGRRGRHWQSEAQGGVYMTLLLRPDPHACVAGLPLVFGMAAREAMVQMLLAQSASEAGPQIGLKWPNDIVVGERKLGGVLVEADGIGEAHPVLRVGIGLNVAPAESLSLAPDVASRYIGLMQLVSHASPRLAALGAPPPARVEVWVQHLALRLVARCYDAFERWAEQGLAPVLAAWPRTDALAARLVTAQIGAQRVVGTACGVGPDGRLRLATSEGMMWVDSGEIQAHGADAAPHSDLTQSAAAVYVGLTPEAP